MDAFRKGWLGVGLQGVAGSQRLSQQLARAHAFSHLEGANGMPRDDMVIDSPTTHNHYQAPSPWPWVLLTIALLGALLVGAWIFALRPMPSPGPIRPSSVYDIGVYEP